VQVSHNRRPSQAAITIQWVPGPASEECFDRETEGMRRHAGVQRRVDAARTVSEIPRPLVDDVILVDDHSKDRTVELARELGLFTIRHDENRGYGGNQKTCYQAALDRHADIIVMVHPDYQYTPKLLSRSRELRSLGLYDIALGSRILGGRALSGGMPLYKYVANRLLTFAENVLIGEKLSEYHTGYRAFSRRVLETLPLEENDDDFVFDNQMLVQAVAFGFKIAEVTCPTLYLEDASSINSGGA